MNDPDWLATVALRSASVPKRGASWCCAACRDNYVEQVARTDAPLMRDMLRLLAEELERATPPESVTHEEDWWCPRCRVALDCATNDERCPTCGTYLGDCQPGDWAKEARAALAAYESGVLPEKGKTR